MHQQQERIHALEDALRQFQADNAKKVCRNPRDGFVASATENDLQHTREELSIDKRNLPSGNDKRSLIQSGPPSLLLDSPHR